MITPDRVREIFSYNPAVGDLIWRVRTSKCVTLGSNAGWIDPKTGYRRIGVDNRIYQAHRLVWLYMTGMWPASQVDHKNTDKSDNRWTNLREATQQQNEQNKPLSKNNTSGYKGAFWHKNKKRWIASIRVDGRLRHLGSFDTAVDAHDAYCRAALENFGVFSRAA
jgi:hypothetical protein